MAVAASLRQPERIVAVIALGVSLIALAALAACAAGEQIACASRKDGNDG